MIPDLAKVVSPPYDIISPEDQKRYHRKDPNNAIRLDFGVSLPDDDKLNNRYSRSAAYLEKWINEQVLVRDSRPAFYICREEYLLPGEARSVRTGFIGAVSLHDFDEGVVLPHERTHAEPKEDRLRLMQETEANLSPIYSLYPDPDHRVKELLDGVMATEPIVSLTDEAGTEILMWVADAPEITAAISTALVESSLFIADGHHRYETALAYRNARRASGEKSGSFDYMMMYLSSMDDDHQPILPVHRFLSGLKRETISLLNQRLDQRFMITTLEEETTDRVEAMLSGMRQAGVERNAFGMVVSKDEETSFHVLEAKEPRPIISDKVSHHSAAWRSLDVAVLDRVILSDLLGIKPGGENAGARISYVERTEPAIGRLAAHDFDLAFFLNSTTMEEVKMVAEAGEKMPQKSTYFYPKPITGLVFRSLRN